MDEDEKRPAEEAVAEGEGGSGTNFIDVTVKTRLRQGKGGEVEVDSADVEVESPPGNGGRGETEGEEVAKVDEGRVAEVVKDFERGELSEEEFLRQFAEGSGKSLAEVKSIVTERLKELGFSSLSEVRDAIEAGDPLGLPAPEVVQDSPVLEGQLSEYTGDTEEKAEPVVEAEVEEGEKKEIDPRVISEKAQWVFESAKEYGRGRMSQSEFDESLAKIVKKAESVTDDEIQEVRDEAQQRLKDLDISSFDRLRDRLDYRWLRKYEYDPLIALVAESPEERRLIKSEVGKLINKERNKKALSWVIIESVLFVIQDMKDLYERIKKALHQSIMEEVQRS
jgi:ElaB/YqjD/DUF883 family membrane-anchored ribosome-binding protein